jgi:hypothetical protein
VKRKAILALSVLFVSVMRPAIADVGSAETLLPIAKISPELMAKVASEGPHDLIVVFDDTAVKQQTETFRTTLRAPLNDQATLDLTAAKLADAKSAVLSAFSSDDVVVLREYSHLSISHIRVQSSQALDKLLAHPGVTGIYENKVLYRAGLAQSLPPRGIRERVRRWPYWTLALITGIQHLVPVVLLESPAVRC